MTFEKGNQINRGRYLTEEHKNKIKENAKNNPNYGMKRKHHTKETCKKIGLKNTRIKLDNSSIIDMYCKENLSMCEIAKRIGHSRSVVYRILKENNILLRKEKFTEYGINKLRNLRSNKTLEEVYGEEKAVKAKGNMSKNNARYWKDKHLYKDTIKKISSKNKGHKSWNTGLTKETDDRLKESGIKCSKTKKRLFTEGKIKSAVKREDVWNQSEKICNLYINELKSSSEIAKIFLCDANTILKILRKNDVNTNISERKKILFAGGKMNIWNDGLTKETDERVNKYSGPKSAEHKIKIGISNLGKNKGKHISEEAKRKGIETKRKNNTLKHSEKTKSKMRVSAFEYAKKVNGIICPRVGKHEKQILDKKEQEIGYEIKRQYLVEGYHVDGYIPELGIVLEIDEKKHLEPKNKEKDIKRQNDITKALNCKFMRINDFD